MTPRIWAVLGDKLGDNAQVQAIAGALPWPVEVRQLVFKPRYRKGKPWFNASLRHVDRAQSAPLEGPWPDLVITIGRRPAMAALWIKAQSGGRTRIVIIGRPKRDLTEFDLVIGSAQYQLPDAANVLKIGLPLMRAEPDRLAAARDEWAERLHTRPRPLVVLLVGGATKPYRLGADTVPELLAAARHYAGAEGSIYISTSRRTGPEARAALVADCPANAELYLAGSDAPNPYLALLDAGDAFVITGDSISMLTEAARLGRRIAVFDLPLHPFWGRLLRFRGVLERLRLVGFERNLGAFHQWLYAHNRAVPSGAELLDDPQRADDDGLARVVDRVRALLAPDAATRSAPARQSGTEEPSR